MTTDLLHFHIGDDWICWKPDSPASLYPTREILSKSPSWQEVVPGIDSIAVQFDPAEFLPEEALEHLKSELIDIAIAPLQEIEPAVLPVCYNPKFALDLELVAAALKISVKDVASWHSELEFSVTMLGFMPGFAYIDCQDAIPNIGRLPQPRQNVAAGSIGVIGSQSCIYSFDSPGGWPIIGRTPLRLFDPKSEQPSLLEPGQQLRFSEISLEQYEEISRTGMV